MTQIDHPGSPATIVVVGDVMIDTVVRVADALRIDADNPAVISRSLGGQAANTAAWLAAIGARPHLVGVLGDDPAAQWVREQLLRLGVPHTFATTANSTGECVIVTSDDGTRTMFPSSGANAQIGAVGLEDEMAQLTLDDSAHVHLSGYTAYHDSAFARHVLAKARDAGVGTSMDAAALTVSTAIDHWRSSHLAALGNADVLLATVDEVQALRGLDPPMDHPPAAVASVADDLRTQVGASQWPGTVIMKAGPLGAFVVRPTSTTHIPSQATHVADTTGAGDAFAAGFLAALVTGSTAVEAAQQGARTAASVIAAIGGQPTIEEGHDDG